MKKLLLTLLLFTTSLVYSQTIITDTLNQCQGDTITLTYMVPTTGSSALFLNCDTASTTFYSPVATHLFSVSLPSNPTDSIQTEWTINFGLDTNLIVEPFSFTFPPYMFFNDGCYRFNVVFTCVSGGTITLTSTWYVSTVGVNELSMNHRKVIKVIDMMGQTTELTPNRLLIKCYNDGTTEKVYITE